MALPSLSPALAAMRAGAPPRAAKPSLMAQAAAALPPPPARVEPQAKPEPAPLTSGVIQTQPISAIPGSSEPMKPVRVKTVQVKAGQMKLASAGPVAAGPARHQRDPPARPEVAETSSAVVAKRRPVAKTECRQAETARTEMPPQPANLRHRQRHARRVAGIERAAAALAASQAMAYADPTPRHAPQTVQQNGAIKPAPPPIPDGSSRSARSRAKARRAQRIDAARSQARGLLNKADPFTEPVVAKDNRKLFRARFAGLERDQAEAVCRTLKRADISCITVRN